MKYIILELAKSGIRVPIIFPDLLTHSIVAAGIPNATPVSAGFCSIHPVINAWGHSESLKLKSSPDDVILIYYLALNMEAMFTIAAHFNENFPSQKPG